MLRYDPGIAFYWAFGLLFIIFGSVFVYKEQINLIDGLPLLTWRFALCVLDSDRNSNIRSLRQLREINERLTYIENYIKKNKLV